MSRRIAALIVVLGLVIAGSTAWWSRDQVGPLDYFRPTAVAELQVMLADRTPPAAIDRQETQVLVIRFSQASETDDRHVAAMIVTPNTGYSGSEFIVPLFRHYPVGEGPELKFTQHVGDRDVNIGPPPPQAADRVLQFCGQLCLAEHVSGANPAEAKELHVWVYPKTDKGEIAWTEGALVYVHPFVVRSSKS
jgi:hypothetical protein